MSRGSLRPPRAAVSSHWRLKGRERGALPPASPGCEDSKGGWVFTHTERETERETCRNPPHLSITVISIPILLVIYWMAAQTLCPLIHVSLSSASCLPPHLLHSPLTVMVLLPETTAGRIILQRCVEEGVKNKTTQLTVNASQPRRLHAHLWFKDIQLKRS